MFAPPWQFCASEHHDENFDGVMGGCERYNRGERGNERKRVNVVIDWKGSNGRRNGSHGGVGGGERYKRGRGSGIREGEDRLFFY